MHLEERSSAAIASSVARGSVDACSKAHPSHRERPALLRPPDPVSFRERRDGGADAVPGVALGAGRARHRGRFRPGRVPEPSGPLGARSPRTSRPPTTSAARTGRCAVCSPVSGSATHELVVIADDDVRYDDDGLERMARLLAGADLVRPQNYFDPLPWHARWDTARILLNRAIGSDHPGTLGVRRSFLASVGGYDGDVLFENLELVRTVRAGGGRVVDEPALFIRRRPPTLRRFLEQRPRQAYDDWAQPLRFAFFLAAGPALVGRWRGIDPAASSSWRRARSSRRESGAPATEAGRSSTGPHRCSPRCGSRSGRSSRGSPSPDGWWVGACPYAGTVISGRRTRRASSGGGSVHRSRAERDDLVGAVAEGLRRRSGHSGRAHSPAAVSVPRSPARPTHGAGRARAGGLGGDPNAWSSLCSRRGASRRPLSRSVCTTWLVRCCHRLLSGHPAWTSRSAPCWSSMQKRVAGRAASRAAPIGRPQASQVP